VNFNFTNAANQLNENDPIFCHFYFAGNSDGNTVVWQFMNNATEQPTVWSNGASSTSALTSTFTSAATSSPNSTLSQASQKSHEGGLSVGATAGRAAAIAVGVLAIVAMGLLFFWRRRKQQRRSWSEETMKQEAFVQDERPVSQQPTVTSGERPIAYPTEMSGDSARGYNKTAEKTPEQPPVELMNEYRSPVEMMNGNRSPVELMNSNRSPVELMDANERYNF
jgi:hypothetical protein